MIFKRPYMREDHIYFNQEEPLNLLFMFIHFYKIITHHILLFFDTHIRLP